AGCGSSAPELIAFTSTRDGNAEVYVMRSDGTHVEDLTENLAQDGEPSWSPDGKTIAFVSARSGDAQIWLMRPAGSGARPVSAASTPMQPSPPFREDRRPCFEGHRGSRCTSVRSGWPVPAGSTRLHGRRTESASRSLTERTWTS